MHQIIYAEAHPKPNPGHYADEVEITINGDTKTLQQAIDDGDFCQPVYTYTYQYSDWNYNTRSQCGYCQNLESGRTQTITRTCGKYLDGTFVENVDCSFCGGVCSKTQDCTYNYQCVYMEDCIGITGQQCCQDNFGTDAQLCVGCYWETPSSYVCTSSSGACLRDPITGGPGVVLCKL